MMSESELVEVLSLDIYPCIVNGLWITKKLKVQEVAFSEAFSLKFTFSDSALSFLDLGRVLAHILQSFPKERQNGFLDFSWTLRLIMKKRL